MLFMIHGVFYTRHTGIDLTHHSQPMDYLEGLQGQHLCHHLSIKKKEVSPSKSIELIHKKKNFKQELNNYFYQPKAES